MFTLETKVVRCYSLIKARLKHKKGTSSAKKRHLRGEEGLLCKKGLWFFQAFRYIDLEILWYRGRLISGYK